MKILKFFGFDRRDRSPIQENKANPPSKKRRYLFHPVEYQNRMMNQVTSFIH